MKQRVLISGASKGIGRAIALELTSDYEVYTFARGPLARTGDQREDMIHHSEGIDINDATSYKSLDLASMDCLINNVGIAHDGLLATQGVAQIELMIQTNLVSVIRLTKLFIRERIAQQRSGVILNISSIVAIRGYKGLVVYSATKGALDAMTRALAREMGSRGFRVNSLLPGFVETDLSSRLTHEKKQRIIRRTPLGRLASVEDIAKAARFLCSPSAAFITGQCLVVDGGLTA
jgi:3-oxoacyl-[acyl-carrier protein] reductase